MPQRQELLPARRSELVCCRAEGNTQYLLRNRATGESFQIGAEEGFLLSTLDGHRTVEEVTAEFAKRFNEPLTETELGEFIRLSRENGLLQTGDSAVGLGPLDLTGATPVNVRAGLVVRKRSLIRSLNGCERVLKCLTWLPNLLIASIHRRVRRLEFTPRPDDVFIVTYPRSGTTWMQMILYQLTTDGDMNLPHIAEYCPWFERSVRSARGFELRPSPRLFKSHLPFSKIPKGAGKYIYVARGGKDVALSYYHLYRRYNGYEGTFDEFFDRFLKGKVAFGSWFDHVRGWWRKRNAGNVLFLHYEELRTDFDVAVRKIAGFCGWQLTPEKLERVRQRSSFEFMKQYEELFDPALEMLWEQGVQLKSFLRSGRVGEGATALTAEQSARFEERCDKRLRKRGVAW